MRERWRVVQVVIHPPGEKKTMGSGYLVDATTVLTAAHVTRRAQDPDQIKVRFSSWAAGRPSSPVVECVHDDVGRSDLAVLSLPGVPEGLPHPNPIRFASLGDTGAELPGAIQGYPLWRRRQAGYSPERKAYRELANEKGRISGVSTGDDRAFDFILDNHPPRVEEDNPWGAMSGGPVWVAGMLVGIVAEHHVAEGAGRLVVRAVDDVYRISPHWLRASLLESLGLPSALTSLPDAARLGGRSASTGPLLEATPFIRFKLQYGTRTGTPLFEDKRCSIGRGPQNTVVVLDDEAVSGSHFSVWVDWSDSEQRFVVWLQDMFSHNGTWVNGLRVHGGSPFELTIGDQIQIGWRTTFVLRDNP